MYNPTVEQRGIISNGAKGEKQFDIAIFYIKFIMLYNLPRFAGKIKNEDFGHRRRNQGSQFH
jgi:hypothetical protein